MREWIKQKPVPFKFVATWDDGTEKTIKLGESRSRYRDAEEALRGAIHIEALDADGDTLRVWNAPASELSDAQTAARTDADPATLLTTFARLLTEGSDRAAERHAEAFRLAYEQQALLTSTVVARLASLETMLHETLVRRVREVEEREEELAEAMAAAAETPAATDDNAGIISHLLSAALTGSAATPPSNGSNSGNGTGS